MRNFLSALASPRMMALLLFLIALAAGFATFVESDYGSAAARGLVYNTLWFETLFALLGINLLLALFFNRLYWKGRWPILLFHTSFLIILVGAAITRYHAVEGTMHIREGDTSSQFTLADSWLIIGVNGDTVYREKANYTVLSSKSSVAKLQLNGKPYRVSFNGFIPNATERMVEDASGAPLASLMILDSLGGRNLALPQGRSYWVGGILFGFESSDSAQFNMHATNSGLVARASVEVEKFEMGAEGSHVYEPLQPIQLQKQFVYQLGNVRFAFSGFSPSARKVWAYQPDPSVQGRQVLWLQVEGTDGSYEVFVPKSSPSEAGQKEFVNGTEISFFYGHPGMELPFSIQLNEFVLERYPGSESPSSFTSHVTLRDHERGIERPFSIFMNNILNYRGYRFYQSSYDSDEKGTFLSVNRDALGTTVTYVGYFLMVLGMLIALLHRGSRFRKLITRGAPLIIAFVGLSSMAQANNAQPIAPHLEHSNRFGLLVVQDQGGRMKPMGTVAGEVLRKLNRSNSYKGLKPNQVFLAMTAFPEYWQEVPIIQIKNSELARMLGVRGQQAAFINFFDYERGGEYKLRQLVQATFASPPSARSAFEKEVIKADEKVNILYQVFSGQLARILPNAKGTSNHWRSMAEAYEAADSVEYKITADLFAHYLTELRLSTRNGNYSISDTLLNQLAQLQLTHGGSILPNYPQLRAEVILNKSLVNERLIPLYGMLGLALLVLALFNVLGKAELKFSIAHKIMTYLLGIGFLAHTLGIALRWFVAGRAPLSNGFETMIYIAWTAMLAGLIFAKRNRFILPATAILATASLFVAHLSWMDPEITNLVPVLKSYWLTIHVAVVTASYGFLGIGAVMALLNLFLFAVLKPSNMAKALEQIKGTSRIVEAVLIIGLYLLAIGSFLGAVWANESWGRYWGWDPKETWAFITIIVYTFITHMRKIPYFGSLFVFNFAATLGIASVLMTFFGVNYYLTGLHSYAGGEAAPFPRWIVLVILALIAMSVVGWRKLKAFDKKGVEIAK